MMKENPAERMGHCKRVEVAKGQAIRMKYNRMQCSQTLHSILWHEEEGQRYSK